MSDAYALVLHSHLPYVRGAGRWPHGEEWVHEAILGTYLPLLVLLHDLRAEGVRYRITIGLTPTLLEQLADPDIGTRFLAYVDDQIRRAELDAWDFGVAGESARQAVAEFYRGSYTRLKHAFLQRFGRDLVGAFADLAKTGQVEILTSAATHGYLPLLDARSVEAQLRVGLASTNGSPASSPPASGSPSARTRPASSGRSSATDSRALLHRRRALRGARGRVPAKP